MYYFHFFIQAILYYVIFMLFFYVASNFIMFPVPEKSYKDQDFNIIKLHSKNGKTISAIYLDNPTSKHTILISHGNYEDLGNLYPFLEALKARGFSVFAYDYQGYGTSQGAPSESKSYDDIETAYDYLTKSLKIPVNQIILFGRSLGTGPTVDLASRKQSAGVILQSPMLTAFRIITVVPLFPLDRYRNNQKIKQIKVPILFIHGTKDEVIPFWHSKKLYELAHEPKYFYAVENAKHNDLMQVAGDHFWEAIQNFENSLPK